MSIIFLYHFLRPSSLKFYTVAIAMLENFA